MGIKVHGVPVGATLRVLVILEELEIDYELVLVDMRSGAIKQQPFLSLSVFGDGDPFNLMDPTYLESNHSLSQRDIPFGQVPAFEDGDLKLFESRAITKYIAHAYEGKGTSLINKDKNQMANIAVWMEVEAQRFDPIATKLIHELFFTDFFGKETDNTIVEENEAKLAKVLDVYEARLAMSKYLAGECFTLADLHHMPALQYLMRTKVKQLIDERPHVSTWCKDVLTRPAWEKVWALQEKRLKGLN